jgi:hypothetical protein
MNHSLPKDQPEATDNQQDADERPATPSWFTQTYRGNEQEFLVDQYRRSQEPPVTSRQPDSDAYEIYRRRMMDRLREQSETFTNRSGQQRPTLPSDDILLQDRHFTNQQKGARGQRKPNKDISRYVMVAGLFAVIAGGSSGFAVTRYEDIATSVASMFHRPADETPSNAAPVVAKIQETTISKKPITMATLKVADVSGSLNSMIPMALRADPATATQELALQISGLPKSAYLSKGVRTSDTTWLLKDGEETGLNLFVPKSDTAKFDMSVAAIETKTGELAAPIQEMTVALNDASLQISPANALPETTQIKVTQPDLASTIPAPQPVAVIKPPLSAEVSGLLQKGDTLFKAGDLVIARQFYDRAFQMGAADGAMGVARTYDPAIYKQMNVRGIAPDAELAAQWYEKAKVAGASSETTPPPVASLP